MRLEQMLLSAESAIPRGHDYNGEGPSNSVKGPITRVGPEQSETIQALAAMKVFDATTAFIGNYFTVTDSQRGFRVYEWQTVETIWVNSEGVSANSEVLAQASDHHLLVAEGWSPRSRSRFAMASRGRRVRTRYRMGSGC